MGFCIVNRLSSSSYYVLDYTNSRILIYDDSWKYSNFKEFRSPSYMTQIRDYLYLTGQYGIYKTDVDLNVILQYNDTGTPAYRGIYYDSNDSIYVAKMSTYSVLVFDLNLKLIDSLTTVINGSPYSPWSIQGYDNKLYIGTDSGTILVISNKKIIESFNGCNGFSNLYSFVSTILFDRSGYMATSCLNNALYLYNSNRRYMNKTLSTPSLPHQLGFDLNGSFILISQHEINIFS